MTKRVRELAWQAWLSSRPGKVRETAMRYPPGTRFRIHDKIVHVIAYNEDGGISVTPIDPAEDYQRAVRRRRPVCRCCADKLDALRI